MTILVTGACGFIGSWTVRRLLEYGERVVLTDLKRDYHRLGYVVGDPEKHPFVEGDISVPGLLDDVLSRFRVDAVIHLAAFQIPQCRANPVQGALVNVVGTVNVFEACRKHIGQVRRVVYASSAAVYGPPEIYGEGPVPVNAILRPTTHYGAYKVCNELTANAYWHEAGISSAGFRPQVVYGYGRDVGVTSDATRALKAGLARIPFKIRFGGMIDLQYVEDVADLFVKAALKDYPGARVYNIRGTVMHVSDLIKLIEVLIPESKGLLTYEDKPLPIPAVLDDSETERDFGPLLRTPPEEGLAQTIQFFRNLLARGELDLTDLKPQ
jgi:nucleoside-diphosphate-sugar epimerase